MRQFYGCARPVFSGKMRTALFTRSCRVRGENRAHCSALIPFVRTAYAQPTSYEWKDQHGSRHQIWQHEGGEQGDPLMPLLFCLAVHNALTAIQDQLRPGECVFAFLDDIYVVSLPERTRAISSTLSPRSWARAQEWSYMRARPGCGTGRAIVPDIEELGPDVWNAA